MERNGTEYCFEILGQELKQKELFLDVQRNQNEYLETKNKELSEENKRLIAENKDLKFEHSEILKRSK